MMKAMLQHLVKELDKVKEENIYSISVEPGNPELGELRVYTVVAFIGGGDEKDDECKGLYH